MASSRGRGRSRSSSSSSSSGEESDFANSPSTSLLVNDLRLDFSAAPALDAFFNEMKPTSLPDLLVTSFRAYYVEATDNGVDKPSKVARACNYYTAAPYLANLREVLKQASVMRGFTTPKLTDKVYDKCIKDRLALLDKLKGDERDPGDGHIGEGHLRAFCKDLYVLDDVLSALARIMCYVWVMRKTVTDSFKRDFQDFKDKNPGVANTFPFSLINLNERFDDPRLEPLQKQALFIWATVATHFPTKRGPAARGRAVKTAWRLLKQLEKGNLERFACGKLEVTSPPVLVELKGLVEQVRTYDNRDMDFICRFVEHQEVTPSDDNYDACFDFNSIAWPWRDSADTSIQDPGARALTFSLLCFLRRHRPDSSCFRFRITDEVAKRWAGLERLREDPTDCNRPVLRCAERNRHFLELYGLEDRSYVALRVFAFFAEINVDANVWERFPPGDLTRAYKVFCPDDDQVTNILDFDVLRGLESILRGGGIPYTMLAFFYKFVRKLKGLVKKIEKKPLDSLLKGLVFVTTEQFNIEALLVRSALKKSWKGLGGFSPGDTTGCFYDCHSERDLDQRIVEIRAQCGDQKNEFKEASVELFQRALDIECEAKTLLIRSPFNTSDMWSDSELWAKEAAIYFNTSNLPALQIEEKIKAVPYFNVLYDSEPHPEQGWTLLVKALECYREDTVPDEIMYDKIKGIVMPPSCYGSARCKTVVASANQWIVDNPLRDPRPVYDFLYAFEKLLRQAREEQQRGGADTPDWVEEEREALENDSFYPWFRMVQEYVRSRQAACEGAGEKKGEDDSAGAPLSKQEQADLVMACRALTSLDLCQQMSSEALLALFQQPHVSDFLGHVVQSQSLSPSMEARLRLLAAERGVLKDLKPVENMEEGKEEEEAEQQASRGHDGRLGVYQNLVDRYAGVLAEAQYGEEKVGSLPVPPSQRCCNSLTVLLFSEMAKKAEDARRAALASRSTDAVPAGVGWEKDQAADSGLNLSTLFKSFANNRSEFCEAYLHMVMRGMPYNEFADTNDHELDVRTFEYLVYQLIKNPACWPFRLSFFCSSPTLFDSTESHAMAMVLKGMSRNGTSDRAWLSLILEYLYPELFDPELLDPGPLEGDGSPQTQGVECLANTLRQAPVPGYLVLPSFFESLQGQQAGENQCILM